MSVATRVPATFRAIRLQATAREYREHVMDSGCFKCGRNLWCPTETSLGNANDAAAHAYATSAAHEVGR